MSSQSTLIGQLASSLSGQFRAIDTSEFLTTYAFLAGPNHWFFRHVYADQGSPPKSPYEAVAIFYLLLDELSWEEEDISYRHCDPYLASLEYLNRWAIAHDSHYTYVCDQLAEGHEDLYKLYDVAYGIWIADLESGVQSALIDYCRAFGAEPFDPCPNNLHVIDGRIE